MSPNKWIANWLESHWVAPAFSGWLLAGLSIFFFGAATNTLAGWLYVISGTTFAILLISAILPPRYLRSLQVVRFPIAPVSAGQDLTIELQLENPTAQARTLLRVEDDIDETLWPEGKSLKNQVEEQPHRLGSKSIELIPAKSSQRWVYHLPTQKRGVYHWHTVKIRTAAPLGLFWCQRSWEARAKAIVYPPILPLGRCPLVDEIGREEDLRIQNKTRAQAATEGLTRALRPYRWGDPTRLIHWRTSARYGELRVRELEVVTGGQEIIVCLDSHGSWQLEDFEQAVIAAISIFCYASKHQQTVKLWTAGSGLVKGERVILEVLAATTAGETITSGLPPDQPLIWITQNPASLPALPYGSRWLLWPTETGATPGELVSARGLMIHRSDQPLQLQLQSPLQTRGL